MTAAALVAFALVISGCGSDAPTQQKTLAQVTPDLTGADPRLVRIADQSGQLLPGGKPAFEARMASLHGMPVVVNKWASWCGPCRAEAADLQEATKKLGNRVAFLGVNLSASDATDDAKKFMRKYPLPYPSYVDDDLKISAEFPPAKSAPVTNFYDAQGRLVHSQALQLDSADQIEQLIERYAGPIPAGPTG